jgi:hypothetical protein
VAAGDGRPDAEVDATGDARRSLLEDAQPRFLAKHEERVHHSQKLARRKIATAAVSSINSRSLSLPSSMSDPWVYIQDRSGLAVRANVYACMCGREWREK